MSKTSEQFTVGGFPSRTKRDWRLIILLGLLVNIILIYPKLTPQLTDIGEWDEAGYIYGGKELASGNFESIGKSPLAATFYALTYLPVQGSPDWFVYSCALGRFALFGLLWLGSYLVAMRLAEYSSPLIIIGFLLISPVLPSIITNGNRALFAAISSFALWQLIPFFREKAIKHLCLASFFVGLAISARTGDGTFLFLALVGFSILLGINAKHTTVYLLSSLLPCMAIFGAYLLLNFLVTGKFVSADPGYLYTAFEQGQGQAYQSNYPGRNFYVEGMLDARRLFGTPGSPDVESLALVEFVGCVSARLGSPNDEVFEGHPLSGKGLDGYTAQRVVNSRWLAELAEAVAGQGFVQRRAGAFPGVEQVENFRAEGRQGDVLGRYRADARAQPGATRTNGDARRADGNSQLPGFSATTDDGKGHQRASRSGITAITSISISHSGWPRPATTSPVEIGNTPLSHLPISR